MVNNNPFIIDISSAATSSYTIEDYIYIQKQLDDKNIDDLVTELYNTSSPALHFYDLPDFKRRCTRGIRQKLIDPANPYLPLQNLYQIGDGGNGKNCIVCCTPFFNDNENSRLTASQQIKESLELTGYNGYFYLFNGGFPNPTGIEMKYIGVPYCFKIFMMLEAKKKGFQNILWIDSRCISLKNPEPLFNIIEEHSVLFDICFRGNNYEQMAFSSTRELLNRINNNRIEDAYYLNTIVFGLNVCAEPITKIIDEYYEMVKLGLPFLSIFPEEIVLSSIFNKSEYKNHLNYYDETHLKLQISEFKMQKENAIQCGYYFYHTNYKI